jgi:hypothetical protein
MEIRKDRMNWTKSDANIQVHRLTMINVPMPDKAIEEAMTSPQASSFKLSASRNMITISPQFVMSVYRFSLDRLLCRITLGEQGDKRSMSCDDQNIAGPLVSISVALWMFFILYLLDTVGRCFKMFRSFGNARDVASVFSGYERVKMPPADLEPMMGS